MVVKVGLKAGVKLQLLIYKVLNAVNSLRDRAAGRQTDGRERAKSLMGSLLRITIGNQCIIIYYMLAGIQALICSISKQPWFSILHKLPGFGLWENIHEVHLDGI